MLRHGSYAAFGLLGGLLLLSASEARADVVTLRDGTRLEGQVKLQELGKYVVILVADGTQKTVMWEDLKGVDVTAPPTPPSAPDPAALGT